MIDIAFTVVTDVLTNCLRVHVLFDYYLEKHLQCETCQKILKTEKGLAEHQEMHKTGPKICPECGKALHSKSSICRYL